MNEMYLMPEGDENDNEEPQNDMIGHPDPEKEEK